MIVFPPALPATAPPSALLSPQPSVAAAPVPAHGTIRSLQVVGARRLEAETILTYTRLRTGTPYTSESVDQAIKDIYASGLVAEVSIGGVQTGDLVIRIRENPIVNRVVLEGNKRLKDDKIAKEIKLAPRQLFSRTVVGADVARIIELYRRQGRFAAKVTPKMVMLDQNRVDVIFEVDEGPKSLVRQINILGNAAFDAATLRANLATKEARLRRFLSSATSYDEDRMAYDQQKLRQFYLTQGYADFRVLSAVAELTPDRRDFILTYVVEEGHRYRFGPVTVDSALRDLESATLTAVLTPKKGDWYNARLVEDSVDQLSTLAGNLGYASADIRPDFERDAATHTMGVTFNIAEARRTTVERIDVTGNTQTQDKVIRREFRVAEGDAFSTVQLRRSQDRINSLGYFQNRFIVEQQPGTSPDKVVLAANVEEKSTGELSLSAGYSSQESFLLQGSIRQRNFRGLGQDLQLSASTSAYARSVELGFTEPYLFDRNIAVGFDLFRRDYRSYSTLGDNDSTTYQQVSTGFQLRAAIPLTEYWSLSGRYKLSQDDVTLDTDTYYTNGACDAALAGQYLCDAVGSRLTSAIGYSFVFDNTDNRIRPTNGFRLTIGQDLAGLGGDTRYLRTTANATRWFNLNSNFVLSAHAEGGYIDGFGRDVLLTDRFFLGDPQLRGFDLRGVGPRVTRSYYDLSTVPASITSDSTTTADALGGNAYYATRLELELPMGAAIREMGIRPSIYADVGAVFRGRRPTLVDSCATATAAGTACLAATRQYRDGNGNALYLDSDGNSTTTVTDTPYTYSLSPYRETYSGNSASPRLSIGLGVNWNSPFGPLRIDVAKALLKQPGDDTKLVTFNVGASF